MLRCLETRTSICPEKAITRETCARCGVLGTKNGMKRAFAKAIMRTQEIHEESYDVVAANKATEIAAKKGPVAEAMLSYERYYTKSLMASADEAVKESGLVYEFSYIIYLLCKYSWNDVQGWADTKT